MIFHRIKWGFGAMDRLTAAASHRPTVQVVFVKTRFFNEKIKTREDGILSYNGVCIRMA